MPDHKTIANSRKDNSTALRNVCGQFIYIETDDEYECPAGKRLSKQTTTNDGGKKTYRYWRKDCQQCHLKQQCTPGKERRVSRWEHEEVLEAAQARLERHPAMMAKRQATVEHPSGTIKSWLFQLWWLCLLP